MCVRVWVVLLGGLDSLFLVLCVFCGKAIEWSQLRDTIKSMHQNNDTTIFLTSAPTYLLSRACGVRVDSNGCMVTGWLPSLRPLSAVSTPVSTAQPTTQHRHHSSVGHSPAPASPLCVSRVCVLLCVLFLTFTCGRPKQQPTATNQSDQHQHPPAYRRHTTNQRVRTNTHGSITPHRPAFLHYTLSETYSTLFWHVPQQR